MSKDDFFFWAVVTLVAVVVLLPFGWIGRLSRRYSRYYQDQPRELTPIASEKIKAFHLAEYAALQAETLELTKTMFANFQYAILASAGLFAWFLNLPADIAGLRFLQGNPELLRYAAWLPPLLAWFFFIFTASLYARAAEISFYVWTLERRLGEQWLGWQARLKTYSMNVAAITIYQWLVLIVGNLVISYHIATTKVPASTSASQSTAAPAPATAGSPATTAPSP